MDYKVQLKLDLVNFYDDNGQWIGKDAITVDYSLSEGYRLAIQDMHDMTIDEVTNLINVLQTVVTIADREYDFSNKIRRSLDDLVSTGD